MQNANATFDLKTICVKTAERTVSVKRKTWIYELPIHLDNGTTVSSENRRYTWNTSVYMFNRLLFSSSLVLSYLSSFLCASVQDYISRSDSWHEPIELLLQMRIWWSIFHRVQSIHLLLKFIAPFILNVIGKAWPIDCIWRIVHFIPLQFTQNHLFNIILNVTFFNIFLSL